MLSLNSQLFRGQGLLFDTGLTPHLFSQRASILPPRLGPAEAAEHYVYMSGDVFTAHVCHKPSLPQSLLRKILNSELDQPLT